MSRTIELTVPLPPNLANGRYHWRKLARLKKDYYADLDARQSAGLIPPPPERPMRRPLLESVMLCGAKHDADNAVSRHKWTIDWLATRGYIENDRALEWHSFPRQDVKRRESYELKLTLWERAA